MKNITKLFAIALVVIGSAATSFAQSNATATATTSATIIAPISLTKNTDMNFGNVATSAVAGTVVLGTNSVRTANAGASLPVTTGTVSAAKFTVNGNVDATYSIVLPGTITLSNGTNNMTVGTFTSTPTATGLLTLGAQEILVGATLNVGANQVAGVYTNASDLSVTVAYN
jgi:hypothetical protein